jgi:Glycosyl transferases group 1
MKVYVFPADAYGCGHYRLIWPADVLRSQGHDVIILPPRKDSGFLAKYVEHPDGRKELVEIKAPPDADVVVIQRPGHEHQPQMVDMLRAMGVAVVVDMDDDMSSIDPGNSAYAMYSPRSNTPYSWRNALESCKRATMVTTSTSTLQKVYAGHGRGRVLDNYMPAACLAWDREEVGAFGWAGTTQSHPNDLQVTGRTVQRLRDEGHCFRVVGGKSKVSQALNLTRETEYTGTVDLIDWVKTIGQAYDVGMVPLAATAFNRAKSRLKGIEHMAAGVPWVASPREEYRRLHRESGCGLLAETSKDWYTQLTRLLGDDVLRKEQAEMGREYMKDQTYQAQAWRWMGAWEEALKIQRGVQRG